MRTVSDRIWSEPRLSGAIGLLLLLLCCAWPLPPPNPPATCPETCPAGTSCTDPKIGCVPIPTCPASCPLGTACTDPKIGCVPIPAPGHVCVVDKEFCGCWIMPPGTGKWEEAVCGQGQVCNTQTYQCETPTPTCPEQCPTGQVCTDPAVGCVPKPPPQQECVLSGDPGPPIEPYTNVYGPVVNRAISELHPECEVGGRCVIAEGRQDFQKAVEKKLREFGYCSGQHQPTTDELALAVARTQPWEGWHVYVGPLEGPGTVLWAPQAARGASEAPPLIGGGCGVPLPDPSPQSWVMACNQNAPWVDCNPVTKGTCAYCSAIGMGCYGPDPPCSPIRCGCPMRNEGVPERLACERYVIGWPGEPADPVLESRNGAKCEGRSNPFQFWPNGGNCRLCNVAGTVCGDWY